ncbi:hypothetical protein SK128_019760 [Halocaridina rubra]|uniref:Uncharacterized protein n=1 Tax=Halocaridina rubra TaxID=373956 RepID=A0AAN9AE16_HALRR
MKMAIGPIKHQNFTIHIIIKGDDEKNCEIKIISNIKFSKNITLEVHCTNLYRNNSTWESKSNWGEFGFEFSNSEMQSDLLTLVINTPNQKALSQKTFLKAPLRMEIKLLNKTTPLNVFFNCEIDCLISPYGLEDFSNRNDFYIFPETTDFTVEVMLQERTRNISLSNNLFPHVYHWHHVAFIGKEMKIEVQVDDIPVPGVPTLEVIPQYHIIGVTLSGSAKASLCPHPELESFLNSGIIIPALIAILVLIATIIACVLWKRNETQKAKIRRERENRGPSEELKPAPYFLGRERDSPPPVPPPLKIYDPEEIELTNHYASPLDAMPDTYTYLTLEDIRVKKSQPYPLSEGVYDKLQPHMHDPEIHFDKTRHSSENNYDKLDRRFEMDDDVSGFPKEKENFPKEYVIISDINCLSKSLHHKQENNEPSESNDTDSLGIEKHAITEESPYAVTVKRRLNV